METYTLPYVKDIASDTGSSAWCSVATPRGVMRWEVGGAFRRLIHVDVWERPTQYSKAFVVVVQSLSHVRLCDAMNCMQHTRLLCPSLFTEV